MLLAGSRLTNTPVLGLQTGGELARTSRAIVDPRTLEIVAYEVTGPLLNTRPSLLRIADVREFSDVGLIIDSSDEFVAVDDIIKLKEIYQLRFDPIGMAVNDKNGKKLGRVIGYTLETAAFTIQQLSVKRPMWRSLADTELLVHRTQIIEINDHAIIIESKAVVQEPMMDSVRAVYANPFRKSQPADFKQTDQSK